MTSKVIQLSVTKEEYDYLQERAIEKAVSIPMYIKEKVFPEGSTKDYMETLISLVNELPPDTKFSIKSVFGVDWFNIPKSNRLSLGRNFMKKLMLGGIENIEILNKDSANTQWYKKK